MLSNLGESGQLLWRMGLLRNFTFGCVFAGLASGVVSGVGAQSLTPDELRALVDERVDAQNPYQEILADPDPDRSLAAMQIMLESRDPDLTRMALEFGLLSPNPTVRRIAVEALMATGPVLSLRLDGTGVQDTSYVQRIRDHMAGTLETSGIGFVRLDVADFSESGSCYLDTRDRCLFTINSDGIFLSARFGYSNPILNARMVVNDAGQLEGIASIDNVDEPVPVTIQLID
jgi:hypothetical protein